MRGKPADLAQDRLLIRLRHRDAPPLRGERKRGTEVGAKVEVRAGDSQKKGGLQHRGEPLATHRRITENAREVRIERAQIEQRLIDVEHEHAVARSHRAERAGFEPASLSATRFPSGRTRPLCDLSRIELWERSRWQVVSRPRTSDPGSTRSPIDVRRDPGSEPSSRPTRGPPADS